jgi:hypothetical protein
MNITITISDSQAALGNLINKNNLKELCERTISEKLDEWTRISTEEVKRVRLEKYEAAPVNLKTQLDAVVVPTKPVEPIEVIEPK